MGRKTHRPSDPFPNERRPLTLRTDPDLPRDEAESRAAREHLRNARERIREIEAKALRKPKHPSRSRNLRSFLDT